MEIESMNGYTQMLSDVSAEFEKLIKAGFMPTIHFGYSDVINGYGWHIGMVVLITLVGNSCRLCAYDETAPDAEYWEYEKKEDEQAMKGRPHRHQYTHTERTVFVWDSNDTKQTLKQSITQFVEQSKTKYARLF